MSSKTFTLSGLAAFVALATSSWFNAIDATAGLPCLLNQTGCQHCCPACDHVCTFDAELGEEERTCFEVEKKVICIPRVVFPWQTGQCCLPFCKKKSCNSCDSCDGVGCSDCIHNGARTRTICVLKTKKYSCPKCKYSWTPEKRPCGSCCDDGCAAAPRDAVEYLQPHSDGMQPVQVQGSQEVLVAPAQ